MQSLCAVDTDSYFLSNLLRKYQSAGQSVAILALRPQPNPATENSDPLLSTSTFKPAIIFAMSDPIRSEAGVVISQLQRNHHIDVFMCTGDNETTARAVASSLGISTSNVMANVLPNQKAEFIRKIQSGELASTAAVRRKGNQGASQRRIVAFVGDGTNDSPALAAADVSIAMASGSDIAVNTASFILLHSNLTTIVDLISLSFRVFRRIKMNFVWAAVYNVCLVPIAAGVLYPIVTGHSHKMVSDHMVDINEHWKLSPVWASLAMALSSISVVLSSLALRIEVRTMLAKVLRKSKGE